MINRQEFKHKLRMETMCGIQYTGWSCGTCFFTMSASLTNSDWQNLEEIIRKTILIIYQRTKRNLLTKYGD